jgi:translation initiation factor IF-2
VIVTRTKKPGPEEDGAAAPPPAPPAAPSAAPPPTLPAEPAAPAAEAAGPKHAAAAPVKPSLSKRPPLKIGSQRKTGKPTVSTPERVGPSPRFDAPVRPSAAPEPKRPLPVQPPVKPPVKKEGDEAAKPPAKKEPTVRLAAMPDTPAAPPPPKSDEPAPQEPIMKLPKDAIRGAKEGSKAPLEQFTKQQDKRRKPAEKGKRKVEKGTAADKEMIGDVADKAPAKGGRDRRRGRGGEGTGKGSELADMAGTREARQRKRRDRRLATRLTVDGEEESEGRVRGARRRKTALATAAAPRKEKVIVTLPCTVRAFSEASGVPNSQIQKALMNLGTLATINTEINQETAELLAAELGADVEIKQQVSLEESVLSAIRGQEDEPDQLQARAPVVTFLGHVDHGKTSLLDRIIGIDVVSGEAGGITQHIRAYTIKKDDRQVSFVDTPGHEAFTEMRARGANVTDIAVLIVAADDGVMPQTEEAISHAKAAEVPIVVALNKMDLPGANPDRALQQLSTHELLPAEWGGDVEVVKTSAVTGDGVDDLLETLLLTADLHEYKANPDRQAYGTCLEAQQEGGRGVVAKLIVQNGTLRVGDVVVCGAAHGRVKAMYNTLHTNKRLREAPPSTPVNITGFDVAPGAGEPFYVLSDIAQAREIAASRGQRSRVESLSGQTATITFEEFQRRREEGLLGVADEKVTLNLIIRADVRGSIEAIQKELAKFDHPEVQVKVLQATVGGVTVADVTLAHASDAVILGFNVIPEEAARSLADDRGVEIRRYDVIYKLTEEIRALLEGKLKPEERVVELGRALVQQVFSISRVGNVAGCRVLAGTIERGCRIRVNRESRGIGEYDLDSLRREKDDVREVREGFECGIKLAGFNDLKEGDILEAYKTEEHKRTLE